MHNGAASEIDSSDSAQPSAVRPDPMGDGIVDEGGPDEGEDQEVSGLLALGSIGPVKGMRRMW